MSMPDETRECPVTPQELREFAEQLGGVFWPRKIHALVDWLEQSSEQPAVPQGTRPLSSYAFSEYGNDAKLYNGIADLERRNTELLADKERLDWLEAALRDENRWADISMRYDDEDGFWLSRIERGIIFTENTYASTDYVRNADMRAAIDAARGRFPQGTPEVTA